MSDLTNPAAGYPGSGYDAQGNFHYYPGGPALPGPAQIPTGSHFEPGPGGIGGSTIYDYGGTPGSALGPGIGHTGGGPNYNQTGQTGPAYAPAPGSTGGGIPAGGAGSSQQSAAQSQANGSAMGILENELSAWGLNGLTDWAWSEIISGKSVDQIIYDLRQTDVYKNSIFGQTNAIRTANGLPVMDENTILQFKDQTMQIARAAGLPQGFITDTELAQLMGQDVSVSEVNSRITDGYVRATQAPPEVAQALQQYYGIDTGHLAAYYLDPSKALPLLQKQLGAATAEAQAQRTGFGNLSQQTAEQVYTDILAQHSTSLSTDEAMQKGFTDLAKLSPLFTGLPGSNEGNISQQVALGAEFEGNAADQLMVQRREEARKAAFGGGSRFGENTRGVEGLGVATSA